MAEGSVKTLDAGNDQGYFIVKLDSIQRGDAGKQPAIVDAVKQQMSRVVGNEYVEQFARAAQADVGVKRNDAAVAKVKQKLRGSASPQCCRSRSTMSARRSLKARQRWRSEQRRVGKEGVSTCAYRW